MLFLIHSIQKISESEKVAGVRNPHFWPLTQNTIIGSLVITVRDAATDSATVGKFAQKILRAAGVDQITVQVEEAPQTTKRANDKITNTFLHRKDYLTISSNISLSL